MSDTDDGEVTQRPTLTKDRYGVIRDGEEITVWNRLTVSQRHEVRQGEIVSHHTIFAGDGSTADEPNYITPEMADQLRQVDVYPAAEVVDPLSEEVQIL